jgi:small subunit ribosomal protein S3
MGQKVHPTGIRLGIVKDWTSKWYADSKQYASLLNNDLEVRDYLKKRLSQASVSRIQIDRPANNAHITVHTARPGLVIGKKGEDIDALRSAVSAMMGIPVHMSIEEIRKPELDAQLVGESIAQQLERRVMFRRAMKRAVQNAMRLGAEGIKVNISGRLNGAEIARSEWYREGRVPLHTLRADIDYGFAEANTTYGIIGVKVWVFKGEVFGDREEVKVETKPAAPSKRS